MAAEQHTNGRRPAAPERRTLPHDIGLEASVLGGIILRNEALADLEELEIDDFYHHPHKVVFEAIRNLAAADRPIDIVTLEHEIEKRGKLAAIGGAGFLGELALKIPTVDNVGHYAKSVLQLSKNRQAIIALSSAVERAYNWPHDPSELISEVVGELTVTARIQPKADRTRWCMDFESFLGDAEPDDDDAIDWVIRDIIPRGEPALWGGPMKAGKTWGAMDLLVSVALGESWLGKFANTWGGPARVLGVFLEDNERRIRKRLWELSRARFKTPSDEVLREHMKISRAPLQLPDAKDLRRFIAEVKAWKPALVVIDNLTRVLVGDPNSTRDAALFSRAWTQICEETGACVMFLHHTRKAGNSEQKGDVDPFETLRGSNDFGACARNIIVTTPIRTETELLAEVRMRGNLDLQRNGFVMGFERSQLLDRWRAKLTDRGEIESVKQDVRYQQKQNKERAKREEAIAENNSRKEIALHIARTKGHVSGLMLAVQLGLSSPRGKVAQLLTQLVDDRELVPDGVRGYRLATDSGQESLPVIGSPGGAV